MSIASQRSWTITASCRLRALVQFYIFISGLFVFMNCRYSECGRQVQHNAQVGADIAVELALASSERSNAPSLLSPCFRGSTPPRPETGHHRQPHPRVVIFGGAVADIVSKPRPGSALTPGTSNPGETRRSFGGVGRNVAEGLARLLQMPLVPPSEEGVERNEGNDGMGGDITLVSAVGADDAGRALVAACEKAGVSALGTVEVAPPADEDDRVGTASYVAVLGGDGDLVAAVADMRVMDRMTGVSKRTTGTKVKDKRRGGGDKSTPESWDGANAKTHGDRRACLVGVVVCKTAVLCGLDCETCYMENKTPACENP